MNAWPGAMPTSLLPMLATPGEPFDSDRHTFEIKWDGIRAIAYLDGERVSLSTRNLKPALPRFPELASIRSHIGARRAVLDGEIVVFGSDGAPDFHAARARNAQKRESAIRRSAEATPAVFIAFDLLYLDGDDLMPLPLRRRTERLADIVETGETLALSRGVVGRGTDYFAAVCARGLEGVVGKDLESPYEPGRRSPHWVKVRNVQEADCVVLGFVPAGTRHFKSLLLGLYDDSGALHYIGNVGTGFSQEENARIRRALDRLPPPGTLVEALPRDVARASRLCKPQLVAAVEFLALTPEGRLRHPSFKGLRTEKEPAACRIESELGRVKSGAPGGNGVG